MATSYEDLFEFTEAHLNHFNSIYNEVKDYTMYDEHRLKIMYALCQKASPVRGDVAELGTFRGGTAKFLARCFPHKKIHVFDTFEGMPRIWKEIDGNYWKPGAFYDTPTNGKTLEDRVRNYLSDCPNVTIYKGLFPDSIPNILKHKLKKFCFFHFDGDLYQSALDSFEFFYPKMSYNSMIFIDDFGRIQCPGVEVAVKEFFLPRPEAVVVSYNHQSAFIEKSKGIYDFSLKNRYKVIRIPY